MQKRKVRSLFLSDIHLANPNSQVRRLSEFLDHIEADHIFLLGDIVDLWKLSNRKGRWYKAHEAVLQKIIQRANTGTRVVYVPGNHDPFFRHFSGRALGPVEVHHEHLHTLANGDTFLLMHGDRFDDELHVGALLHNIADTLYESIVAANRHLNQVRSWLGKPYWSLSVALKMTSKKARAYIEAFEHLAVDYARQQGAKGVICGHIHQAKLTTVDGIVYANDGDWVESCTALIETQDGQLEILNAQGETQTTVDEVEASAAPVLIRNSASS
ncbi:UDP-2,3-diacylglucosamine diphosphatase [Reinekea blandensis]|uniref:Calcineurin-like phosphoesterase domain-containing protein n=1 Tax=Reinekea blandensis MED297 TaxID=314283 RepID=A4BH20_9GAMM|nr:UDP-2,3-diacylglucosamine diphosphatase [Reinekea blandensis]EAR08519.1 hypothetical protein MED297_14895 [Reinekea sp. MED297] [Reinekea blandensis MED297]